MLNFDTNKRYWYLNKKSEWEPVKFIGTKINSFSGEVYYTFTNNKNIQVLLTEKQATTCIST